MANRDELKVHLLRFEALKAQPGATSGLPVVEAPCGARPEGPRMDTDVTAMTEQLDRLNSLSTQELCAEWRRLYRTQAPRISRDLMIRALAYRLQEMAHGGLSKTTQRRLTSLAKSIQNTGQIALDASPQIRTGARLVREWRGVMHVVVVQENGFEYGGQIYPSLTKIAQEITGAHWSGPRFFGVVAPSSTPERQPTSPGQITSTRERANA